MFLHVFLACVRYLSSAKHPRDASSTLTTALADRAAQPAWPTLRSWRSASCSRRTRSADVKGSFLRFLYLFAR